MSTIATSASLDAIVHKVAWRLIPVLFVAYVINFIDRVNISFAKLEMGHALGLDDVAFGVGAGMFFIGYFFFEVPSNLILERIGARRWVPIIMVAWGIATAALAWVTTPVEFYLVRFFIGFAEAGFFPGIVLFMTYWFPLSHRGRMMAIFMAALAVSGVIGGPVCGAIMQYLGGAGGLAGWQWLMIATGLPAVLVGGAIFVLLTDRPEQAHWLSADERQELIASLGVIEPTKPSLRDGLTNFWSWNCAWIYFLLVCGGYGISFWMPTLFSRAGVESAAEIGLLVVIPNLVGGIARILLSRNSDRTQERRWHLSGSFVLGAIGHGGGHRHHCLGRQSGRFRRTGADGQRQRHDRQLVRRICHHWCAIVARCALVGGHRAHAVPSSRRWGRAMKFPLRAWCPVVCSPCGSRRRRSLRTRRPRILAGVVNAAVPVSSYFACLTG
mgnify:CR=1 FL=1|jgi:MFS family permease